MAAALGAPRLAGAANGVSLSTTRAVTLIPRGTRLLSMVGRNYSTAVVARWTLTPWLSVLKTTDAFATEAAVTDYSDAAQDGSTSTDVVLSSIDTLANGDALFLGAATKFRGITVDVDAANGTAATILVEYWNGTAWTDISASDGSASGGASMAQDGDITWTVPTAWVPVALKHALTTELKGQGITSAVKFWLRISFSAALDSSTTLNSLLAMEESTAYAELPSGQVWEQAVVVGDGGYAAVVALTDAGTANLLINCAPRSGGNFA